MQREEELIALTWPGQARTWISYALNPDKAIRRVERHMEGAKAGWVCGLPATRREVAKVQKNMEGRHAFLNWFEGEMTREDVERVLYRARKELNAPSLGDLVKLKDLVWEAERMVEVARDDEVAREWYLKALTALHTFKLAAVTDDQHERHAQLLKRLEDAGARRASRSAPA